MPINVEEFSILTYPAPELRVRSKPLKKVNQDVRSVADRMIRLMVDVDGVGLAAPQVGLPWQLFVTAIPEDDPPHRVYVNPSITVLGSEKGTAEEGCLSLPGIHVEIERAKSVTLTALDAEGRRITASSDGFAARVWQHECDHLDGILIIDKMSPLDRLATRKALKELKSAPGSPVRIL